MQLSPRTNIGGLIDCSGAGEEGTSRRRIAIPGRISTPAPQCSAPKDVVPDRSHRPDDASQSRKQQRQISASLCIHSHSSRMLGLHPTIKALHSLKQPACHWRTEPSCETGRLVPEVNPLPSCLTDGCSLWLGARLTWWSCWLQWVGRSSEMSREWAVVRAPAVNTAL